MKKELSVTAAVYEKENSCIEDVLAIANEIKKKTPSTRNPARTFRYSTPREPGRRTRN